MDLSWSSVKLNYWIDLCLGLITFFDGRSIQSRYRFMTQIALNYKEMIDSCEAGLLYLMRKLGVIGGLRCPCQPRQSDSWAAWNGREMGEMKRE